MRPVQQPSRDIARPGTRPSPGGDRPTMAQRPATLPGGGGGGPARPSTLPAERPGGIGGQPGAGIGDRPGGPDRPSTLPGQPGIGDRPGGGDRPGIGDRPGSGDRPGGGERPERPEPDKDKDKDNGGDSAADREDWQNYQSGNREDWQNWADQNREDWQEYGDDYAEEYGGWGWYGYGHPYYDDDWDDFAVGVIVGGMAGLAVGSVVASSSYEADACTKHSVEVKGETYYRCDDLWLQKAISGGEVSYIVVNPPAGY